MPKINFQPIFEHFDEKLLEVKLELKSDIRRVEDKVGLLQTSVDGIAKITHGHDKEITVINHRLDKLEAKAS